MRLTCATLPDGVLVITSYSFLAGKIVVPEDITPELEESYYARSLEKSMFELYRPWLTEEELSLSNAPGENLDEQRRNLKFDDYVGQIPLTCREIAEGDLPVTHEHRDQWRDDGVRIVDGQD